MLQAQGSHKCTQSHTSLIAACWSTKLTHSPPPPQITANVQSRPCSPEKCVRRVAVCLLARVSARSMFRRVFMKSHRKVFVFVLHANMLHVEVISPESIGLDKSTMTSNVSWGLLNMCISGCSLQANTCRAVRCVLYSGSGLNCKIFHMTVVLILPFAWTHLTSLI